MASWLTLADWAQYPVITAHQPLRERYMSNGSGSYRYQPVSSPSSLPSESTSESEPEASPSSSRPRQTHQSSHAGQAGEPAVVTRKPKKKLKQKQRQKQSQDQVDIADPTRADTGPNPPVSAAHPPRSTATPPETQGHHSAESVQPEPSRNTEPPPDHEPSPWASTASEQELDPRFQIGDEDEFRNVWDGGN